MGWTLCSTRLFCSFFQVSAQCIMTSSPTLPDFSTKELPEAGDDWDQDLKDFNALHVLRSGYEETKKVTTLYLTLRSGCTFDRKRFADIRRREDHSRWVV